MRAILALLTMTSTAAATIEPPLRYIHPNPTAHIVEVPYWAVDPTCRARFPTMNFPPVTATHRILGCATVGNPCLMFVPLRHEGIIPADKWQEIYRHELAHCNGWPASHPTEDHQ